MKVPSAMSIEAGKRHPAVELVAPAVVVVLPGRLSLRHEPRQVRRTAHAARPSSCPWCSRDQCPRSAPSAPALVADPHLVVALVERIERLLRRQRHEMVALARSCGRSPSCARPDPRASRTPAPSGYRPAGRTAPLLVRSRLIARRVGASPGSALELEAILEIAARGQRRRATVRRQRLQSDQRTPSGEIPASSSTWPVGPGRPEASRGLDRRSAGTCTSETKSRRPAPDAGSRALRPGPARPRRPQVGQLPAPPPGAAPQAS